MRHDVLAFINVDYFNPPLILQTITNGLTNGSIYALMALAVVVIFKTTGHMNLAQGELATMSALGVYSLSGPIGWNIWVALPVVVLVSALVGAGIERFLIRPVEGKSEVSVLIVTLGLFLAINSINAFAWGTVNKPALKPFPSGEGDFVMVLRGPPDFIITYRAMFTWLALAVLFTAVTLLLNRTKLGLAYRGVASNRESAPLVGIRVPKMLSLGWTLAAALGAIAAVITSQQSSALDFNLMANVLIYGLAAACLGGFDSLRGAVVGGILIGLCESILPNLFTFIPSEAGLAVALLLIVGVVVLRPEGLFGTKRVLRA